MNELISIRKEKDILVVGSREVARNFKKEHYNLIRDIKNLIKKQPLKFEGSKYFIEATFKHKGNEYGEYLLTRDGLSLLVMGFTGEKALEWKLNYIEAFNKLEKMLVEKQPLEIEGLKNEKKLLEVTARIKELENSLIITYEESNEIKKVASKRVMELVEKNKMTTSKIYGALWRDYRQKFNITSYRNTLKKDIQKAKDFIENWKPSRREVYE